MGQGKQRGKEPGVRAGKRTPPKGAWVVIFHVRDLAPVEELVDGLHLEWERSKRRGKRGGRAPLGRRGHARAADHPPLFLADKDHLIAVEASRGPASKMRRLLERALGDAVQHVQTRFFSAPKAKAPGGAAPRRR
jgi:hypothetical protein